MKVGTWIAIYFIIWWVVLFAALPFGARSQAEAGDITPGTDPGAPVKAPWLRILAATTLVSGILFVGVWWLIENYWI